MLLYIFVLGVMEISKLISLFPVFLYKKEIKIIYTLIKESINRLSLPIKLYLLTLPMLM